MTSAPWFKPRPYRHLDVQIGETFVRRVEDPEFVARHSFLPLLHYIQRKKRYRPGKHKTEFKERPIMYASHRDACILSRYSYTLTALLDAYYEANGLSDAVIAYRKLEKANYDFAADVMEFAKAHSPCAILCFDVTKFFDTLDHKLLKSRLKQILKVSELPRDWYAVFRHVTRFSYFDVDELKKDPRFSERFNHSGHKPIATIQELQAAGVVLHPNKDSYGIPQGTPISSTFSNLYMIDFDKAVAEFCGIRDALYRRYSDDILIACPCSVADEIKDFIEERISGEKLKLNCAKTEQHTFDLSSNDHAQYLGFRISAIGATIRESSLSRQWRKLKKSVARTRKAGEAAIAEGTADKIYTRKLRRRFSALPVRNFSSYARRSARALNSPRIKRQVRRLEQWLEDAIESFAKPLK